MTQHAHRCLWRYAFSSRLLVATPFDDVQGICAGKASVTDYLKYEHGFRSVSLSTGSVAPIQDQLAERLKKAGSLHQAVEDNLTFPTVEALLDFVTTRWRDRWIINGIWNESDLEALLRRPFFLLISVDAPISVRWARYKAKYAYIVPQLEPGADITSSDLKTSRRPHCLTSKRLSNIMTTNYTIPEMAWRTSSTVLKFAC